MRAETIRVDVHEGWITLAGEVEWQYQRVAAEDAVHAVWGVRGVTNSITVRSLVEADIVKDTLEAVLQRRARLHGKKIAVEIHGQKVILSGHVDSLVPCARNTQRVGSAVIPGAHRETRNPGGFTQSPCRMHLDASLRWHDDAGLPAAELDT